MEFFKLENIDFSFLRRLFPEHFGIAIFHYLDRFALRSNQIAYFEFITMYDGCLNQCFYIQKQLIIHFFQSIPFI